MNPSVASVLAGESRYAVVEGDCLATMRAMPDCCIDAINCDPPAGISFMNKTWDKPKSCGQADGSLRFSTPTVNLARNPTCQECGGRKRAGPKTRACTCDTPMFNDVELRQRDRTSFVAWLTEIMREALRVLKPGGHALVWAIPRTSHWTGWALEDAGFECRDVVTHLFASGFPKSTRLNRDPRFCRCGEVAHSVESTVLSQQQDARNDTGADADDDDPLNTDAPRLTDRPRDSLDDCQRDCGCDGVRAPAEQAGGPASSLPPRCAQAHSRSSVPEDDRGTEPSHIPSPARRSAHLSNRDCSPRDTSGPQARPDTRGNMRTPCETSSDIESPEHRRSNTGEFPLPYEQFVNWFSTCQVCGKPIADGFGTALKPAAEFWWLVRRPLNGTVARCVLEHGTGALNIDACRVATNWNEPDRPESWKRSGHSSKPDSDKIAAPAGAGIDCHPGGRWPANVTFEHAAGCVRVGSKNVVGITNAETVGVRSNTVFGADATVRKAFHYASLDGTETVDDWSCVQGCPVAALDAEAGERTSGSRKSGEYGVMGYQGAAPGSMPSIQGNTGSASRFFPCFHYETKASRSERDAGCEHLLWVKDATTLSGWRQVEQAEWDAAPEQDRRTGNIHPTVKNVDHMKWNVRLITPPGGVVLDMFAGSGSTGCASVAEGFRFVGCELAPEHVVIAEARIAWWKGHPGGPTPEARVEAKREASGQLSLIGGAR